MVWIFWLYIVNSLLMLVIAIREVRKPPKALFWLTIGLVLPIVGFAIYLFTSYPTFPRERLTATQNKFKDLPDSFSHSASVIAHALGPLCVHELQSGEVQILENGINTFNKLIQSLQEARRTIDLEYYIYRDDQIGRRITDLLIERAKAGVRVRFLRDGWGSRQFPKNQIGRMVEAGIECRTMFPLRFPWLLSNWTYRDHCKNVVIDGKDAFTGGINIGYEYTGLKPDVGFWRDTHMRIVDEVAGDLQSIFDKHWDIATPEKVKKRSSKDKKAETTPSKNIIFPGRLAHSRLSTEWNYEIGTINGNSIDTSSNVGTLIRAYIQTLEGNPGIPTEIIRETYFNCLTQATRTVDITTPYFVPDSDIIMAIKTAVARGVRVRLLVPNKVELSTLIVGAASRTFYGELLEAGVNIYLYNKGMLHAKVMIVDEEISAIGAANYDMRSFRLDYEVCEVIYSAEVARELTQQFENDITYSVQVTVEDVLQRSFSQRIIDQGCRLLSPLL